MELAKIGDYQDYIYKSEGKWYKYGAVGKLVGNGTENWTISGTGTQNYYYKLAITTEADVVENVRGQLKCNQYTYNQITSTNTLQGIWVTNNDWRIRYGTEETIENFKTNLANNNLIVYYVLATPTITEITDTTLIGQLDSLLAMKTKRTITNMFTVTDNETPTLAVLYRQDLTTLFNNLTSAILSLGNNT